MNTSTPKPSWRSGTYWLALFALAQPFLLNVLQDYTHKLPSGTWQAALGSCIVAAVYIAGKMVVKVQTSGKFTLEDVLAAWRTAPHVDLPPALASKLPVVAAVAAQAAASASPTEIALDALLKSGHSKDDIVAAAQALVNK